MSEPTLAVLPAPGRVRHSALQVAVGSAVVQIFGRAPGPYTVAWREFAGGPRLRAMRTDFKAAKRFATDKATAIANGQTAMSQMTEHDRACYKRAIELIAGSGKPLELVCGEYADAVQKLGAGVSLSDAVKFFLENRPRGYIARPVPQLVTEFLLQKSAEIGKAWHHAVEVQLERFGEYFTGPLHALTSADVNKWLRSLPVGLRTRHNYRAAVDQLVRWAQANGHLPKAWSEMEHVPDPGAKAGDVKILTPEQMTKLLAARDHAEQSGRAQLTLVPFLALGAFAGLRHEEMNGEKAMLDWRDIHLAERYIYVPKNVAKTGADRVVPICDNLHAWLKAHERRNGPISSLAQTSGALTKAKLAAGIPSGKNETKNVLRKSFISYRKAQVKNIAQVAEEAGNSPGVIRKYYTRIIPETEANRWFDIWPTTGEVLQLSFF